MRVSLTLLEKLAEYPKLNNEDFIIFQSYFREYMADTNMMVLDALEESEQETMLKANRERVAYEKKIRDPDDCYFDVRNREEEIRAQGLPSQLGILWGLRRNSLRPTDSEKFAHAGKMVKSVSLSGDRAQRKKKVILWGFLRVAAAANRYSEAS
jgi:hypothetical protein